MLVFRLFILLGMEVHSFYRSVPSWRHVNQRNIQVAIADEIVYNDRLTLSEYSASEIARWYDKRPIEVIERLLDVGTPIFVWWLNSRFDNMTTPFRSAAESAQLTEERANQLRQAIVDGGSVTFIKSGQAIALRQDIIHSPSYAKQLGKLSDEVGTFDNDVAMNIISKELGRPAEEIFDFNPSVPFASASIAVVFKGTVRATGQPVAVKVQRPSLFDTVPIDLYILRQLALFLKKQRKLRSDLGGIVDEFGAQLYGELNFEKELANCQRFSNLYGDIPNIIVPKVYPELSSKRVLTMEFIEGTKGPWVADGERLLTVGLQCSVLQLLGTGFFHADPHRGNLLRTPKGELAYLDFGNMAEISATKRFALIGTVVGLVNKDLDLTISSMAQLDFFAPGTNITDVIDALNSAIINSTENGKRSSLNFTTLNQNIQRIQDKLPFQLPPYYVTIIRSLTILEGLATSVDSDFNLVKGAYPFVLRQILTDPAPELNALLKSVLVNKEGRIKWEKLEQFLTTSRNADEAMKGDFRALKKAQDRSDVVKSYQQGDGPSATVDTVGIEAISQIFDYLLSDNGKFLREPLIEEIVEALELFGMTTQSVVSLLTNRLLPPPRTKPDREKAVRILKLFQVVGARSGAVVGRSNSTDSTEGPLRQLARFVSRTLQDQPQEKIEQLQPLFNKLSVLARQVVGRLIEERARRTVRSIVTPKRVESSLPVLSRAIDLLPLPLV